MKGFSWLLVRGNYKLSIDNPTVVIEKISFSYRSDDNIRKLWNSEQ